MSTLPMGCAVVANGITIPYTYDKNGRRYTTPFFGENLFNEKAYKKINSGETSFNWSLNNITRACQRCEQEGQICGFSSNTRQAFCQHQDKSNGLARFPCYPYCSYNISSHLSCPGGHCVLSFPEEKI
ncbi:hypothetical protein PR202_gb26652 [Eleusine coracana subsp. coracana]|uniref:Wall-associated receptor kinase C-terminal domain-containing protein n=1 Tax=Eleusine coracana subsp. coracana TaxID=191504 RepID=A0AAV5FSD2_ELECO|nr:hypothetical protein PR202_gb26652 [Eleusine coracana subsp. coracana]